ncbi:hypothetical protein E2542_SST26387 [Spatholobus suberectus]|nr:hypothetical protein E2542_SST26387 [Spatholobus suberectus]
MQSTVSYTVQHVSEHRLPVEKSLRPQGFHSLYTFRFKLNCSNEEDVIKNREKKKAYAASLKDEVVKLKALTQHLMKKLQGQASLEAKIARLKCLLVDIRGRIEGKIRSFPYQKLPNVNTLMPNLPAILTIRSKSK